MFDTAFDGRVVRRFWSFVVPHRRRFWIGVAAVLHLDIEPGTDIALFDGLSTHAVEQGRHDPDFIARDTMGLDAAPEASRMSLEPQPPIETAPVKS